MTDRRIIVALMTVVFLTLAISTLACGKSATQDTEATVDNAPPDPEPAVTYEPAYPQEVSEEALTEEDKAQQESSHDPGEDESHEHDETTHTH